MNKLRIKNARALFLIALVAVMITASLALPAMAGPKPPLQRMDTFVVGDRVVDILYNLRMHATGMSVRVSLWPLGKDLTQVSKVLGCPRCIVVKNHKKFKAYVKNAGFKYIIIERSDPFCLYMPGVSPEKAAALLKDSGVELKYIDFSKGVASAVRQVAKLAGKEKLGEELVARYEKSLVKARKIAKRCKSNKRVVILNGIYQPATGKGFVQVEAPGGYSDRFLLEPLGCKNVGADLNLTESKVRKGVFMARRLEGLIKANPDAIVIMGDSSVVQKALAKQLAVTPELAEVPAIAKQAIYSLPRYVDSGVMEYPSVLRKWALALK